MKSKIKTLIPALLMCVCLASCNNSSTDQELSSQNSSSELSSQSSNSSVESSNSSTTEIDEDLTNFEIVQNVMDHFTIDNKDNILSNIYLPKNFADEGVIKWTSSVPEAISPEGFVTRSVMADVNVKLTAIATLGATNERREYNVTVKKIPESVTDKLNESVDNFSLLSTDELDRDIVVLPRITDMHGTYITWKTSDEKIIDLEGNVYRGDEEKNVTLTGTFTNNGESIEKDFNVKVGSIKDDEPEYITESDTRILNKIYVNNNKELIAAVNEAKPGDAIILNDGKYKNLIFQITKSGTEEHPIFVFAKNPGKVTIEGEAEVSVYGDYVTVANLCFTNGYPKTDKGVINFNGDHLRLTNNKIISFQQIGDDFKWVSLTGRFHEIDRNVFDGKLTGGALLTIWRNDLSSQDHHIYKNQFLNYKDTGGGNGYETMRIGTSTYSQSNSNVLVEENYFYNVCGEIEIVSVKSGRTIVRNNTFESCVGLVTLRHGKNSLVINNKFLCNNIVDTGGIRMYDGGHCIRNNYIENANTSSNTRGAIVVHSGVNEIPYTTIMNLQWTPFNILIEKNTIVNSRNSLLIGGKYNYPAKDITYRDNYIVSPEYGAIRFDKLVDNFITSNNYVYAPTFKDSLSVVADVTIPDGIIYSAEIPELIEDENGLYLGQYGAQGLYKQTNKNTGTNW